MRELLSTFSAARRPYINFRQLSLRSGDLPSPSFMFTCSRETFHQLSVKFLGSRETFRHLPSILRVAGRTSINFRPLTMQPEDLASTFCVAERLSGNFHRLSDRP